jgi:hypothetical protein
MPVGIFINALSVAIGGVVGALFGHKLPTRINSELTKIFGVCSMGMGVSSIGLMKNMPAVIFAVIIGTAFGLAVNLGGIINHGAACMEKPVGKIFPNKNASMSREEYMTMLVTIIVLFCASGTGIYGSLDSGMSGDHTILINNTRYVKEETKRLVLKSIEELHYSSDATARSFKTGKRNLIAFIVPDISNPFFATMIEEVENVISKEGFKLLVINTKETKEREIDFVDHFLRSD